MRKETISGKNWIIISSADLFIDHSLDEICPTYLIELVDRENCPMFITRYSAYPNTSLGVQVAYQDKVVD